MLLVVLDSLCSAISEFLSSLLAFCLSLAAWWGYSTALGVWQALWLCLVLEVCWKFRCHLTTR